MSFTITPTPAQIAYLQVKGRTHTGDIRPGFMGDMLWRAVGGKKFSPGQAAALTNAMKRDAEGAAKPAPAPVKIARDLSPVLALFAKAGAALKRPSIALRVEGVGKVELSPAGAGAKVPGSINVTDGGPYGSSKWFGRITPAGEFEAGKKHAAPPALVEALAAFALEPAAVAAAMGKATGHCVFCSRKLTAEDSVGVGYGPICAEKWGLPYGAGAGANPLAMAA